MSYLIATLLIGLVIPVALFFPSRHRITIMLAGAIELLHSPPVIVFNDVYWNPPRMGGGSWGLEDLILSFGLGAGVWAAAIAPLHSRLRYSFAPRRVIIRLLCVGLPPVALALGVREAGVSVMTNLLIVMLATGAVLALLQPRLLRLSAAGVLIYPPYYLAVLFLCGWLIDGFFAIWSGPELWGIRIVGFPIEEIIFVYLFSFCYPLIIGTVLSAQIIERPRDAPTYSALPTASQPAPHSISTGES
ncbi:MAG: hypothetical protein KDK07_03160 [Bauldia sp.]|nr:hypothetical protein [Bauldia sp.]